MWECYEGRDERGRVEEGVRERGKGESEGVRVRGKRGGEGERKRRE